MKLVCFCYLKSIALATLLSTMFRTLQDIAKQEEVWLSCTTRVIIFLPSLKGRQGGGWVQGYPGPGATLGS